MIIREAKANDLDSITRVVSLAFNEEQYLRGRTVVEATLVNELIHDRDDIVNLVAEDFEIVGHVFVSPVSLEPAGRLSCGQVAPLSVIPDYQSQGIGGSLMRAVIEESKVKGLEALLLLGDPNYYRRFGFLPSKVDNVYGVSKYFQELELKPGCLEEKMYAHLASAFFRLGI